MYISPPIATETGVYWAVCYEIRTIKAVWIVPICRRSCLNDECRTYHLIMPRNYCVMYCTNFEMDGPNYCPNKLTCHKDTWRRIQMETFSALLAICAGNSPVTGEFPSQRPVTRSFDVPFDLRLSKRFNKQSRRLWFGTLSCSLWRNCNV